MARGAVFHRGQADIKKTCSECGKEFMSRPYEKFVRCASCRIARNVSPEAMIERRKIVEVPCYECGVTVEIQAYTLWNKNRNGEQVRCIDCIKIRREAGKKRFNEERRQIAKAFEQSWIAPCRMRIVPKRAGMYSRCRPALVGRCHMVGECVDFTARQDWQGWEVAK